MIKDVLAFPPNDSCRTSLLCSSDLVCVIVLHVSTNTSEPDSGELGVTVRNVIRLAVCESIDHLAKANKGLHKPALTALILTCFDTMATTVAILSPERCPEPKATG